MKDTKSSAIRNQLKMKENLNEPHFEETPLTKSKKRGTSGKAKKSLPKSPKQNNFLIHEDGQFDIKIDNSDSVMPKNSEILLFQNLDFYEEDELDKTQGVIKGDHILNEKEDEALRIAENR